MSPTANALLSRHSQRAQKPLAPDFALALPTLAVRAGMEPIASTRPWDSSVREHLSGLERAGLGSLGLSEVSVVAAA